MAKSGILILLGAVILGACGDRSTYRPVGQSIRLQPARAHYVLGPQTNSAMRHEWRGFEQSLISQPWQGFDWKGNQLSLVPGATLTVYPFNDRFRFELISGEGYLFKGEIHRQNFRRAFRPSFEGMVTSVYEQSRSRGCMDYLGFGRPIRKDCFTTKYTPAGDPKISGSLDRSKDLGEVLSLSVTNAPLEVWGLPTEKLEFMTASKAQALHAD